MASHPDSLSNDLSQLSIMDQQSSPPPPPSTPVTNLGTLPHIQDDPSHQRASILSILTVEDMFTEPPTIHPEHMTVQDIFQQPSIVQGRTILSWTSFANIILTLEDVNCPSCAQATILRLTQSLPLYEDNNERLEDIAQRVGGVTILRKWYTLLFWSSVTSENTFFIPGTMGIPNPPSIFDHCRFWNLDQNIDDDNKENDSDIIGEVEAEGEIIFITEGDIVRDRM